MSTKLEQQIRERAYHLWAQDGGQHGHAERYWLIAETEVLASLASPAKTKKPTAAKKAQTSEPAKAPRTTSKRKAAVADVVETRP